jgi:phosphoketolase
MGIPWVTSTNSRTAMIFLNDNTLLKRELKFDDIKPRLLGKLDLVVLKKNPVYANQASFRRSLGNMPWSHYGVLSP